MKKYQIDARMRLNRFGKAIARELGIAYIDLPSKYLIYGQNVRSLNMSDETFSVVFKPQVIDGTWHTQISALIKDTPAYKKFAEPDLKNWAIQMVGYSYLNDPRPESAPPYIPNAMPGAPADADGKLVVPDDWQIKINFALVKVDNMGQ